MKIKYVVLVFVLFVFFFSWEMVLPRPGQYKISRVENGNTVILNNGSTVLLIGIFDTEEAKEFLDDNYLNGKVELLSDSSAPFNPNMLDGDETVHAYVIRKSDGRCINSSIIRMGLSPLNEDFLTDSLKSFKKYYELAEYDE